jgi:photosynthetic reaction center H subunit
MQTGAITQYIDVAQVVLYVFWVFFFGLIFYLRREDKREGYPLVYDGEQNRPYLNFPPIPAAKTFILADGSTVEAPRPDPQPAEINAVPVARWQGAPLTPTGDPMLAGVGPGAYANRANVPDRMTDGSSKILPLRAARDFALVSRDPDPRGMQVVGADGVAAGTVSDVWVDRAEVLVRYLEVDLGGEPAKRVLLPMTFSDVDGNHDVVRVEAILGSQFADVPVLAKPDEVTLLEEDRICAYYGAGTLYATPIRTESIL